jgi:hypothetical protein
LIRNIAREGGAGGMRGEMDLDDGSAEPHRAPKAMLDLENLAFDQGAHLMSNKKCELPKGSYRAQKKGYDEVRRRPPPPPRRAFIHPKIRYRDSMSIFVYSRGVSVMDIGTNIRELAIVDVSGIGLRCLE